VNIDNGTLQILLFLVVLLACVKPLGAYMARVYTGQATWLGAIERGFYRALGTDSAREMSAKQYAAAVLGFSAGGFLLLYAILRWQSHFPWNPAGMADLTPHLAFNTAVSFITNTNWQSYGGESTLSYFSQFFGLTVQNFLSAAAGMAVVVALIRGLARRNSKTIGNFWVDMVRSNLYILLPLALIWTALLQGQGVVQTFSAYKTVPLVEAMAGADGTPVTEQVLAVGPTASQIAIKQLGTNGGGFFNANSAHPFENPTPFSNFLEMLAILLIPAALCYTFGSMVGDKRQGWAVLAAMTVIFIPLTFFCVAQEQGGNPKLEAFGIAATGNMEGKETRFGITNSALWATATTAASNGSVNAMHDSFTPLGGLVPLLLIDFGEVIYGGAGSGLYGMLIFVIITVFIAGLMVGRTPEYLGKKIGAFEIKMASVAILVMPITVLFFTALAVVSEAGLAGLLNRGPHGFTEILYAFSSAANNNGSAFAGLTANAPFYDTWLGLAMLIGRFWIIIPVLAIAGSMAAKQPVPVSQGTLPTHKPLFIGFLVGTVILVGVLSFVPSLVLGPIADHFMMIAGN
jgi:K+-transporting ATPase ATPase A chain